MGGNHDAEFSAARVLRSFSGACRARTRDTFYESGIFSVCRTHSSLTSLTSIMMIT